MKWLSSLLDKWKKKKKADDISEKEQVEQGNQILIQVEKYCLDNAKEDVIVTVQFSGIKTTDVRLGLENQQKPCYPEDAG